MAQWARASAAAQSLAQMAARGAKGDAALGRLIRERQDLVAEWRDRDRARTAAVAQAPDKRDRQAEAENTARLADIDTRTAEIDRRLAADFPDYAAFAHPTPLTVEQVRAELRADEALVFFLDTSDPEETFIWVITKTAGRWVRSELGTPSLRREVAALRQAAALALAVRERKNILVVGGTSSKASCNKATASHSACRLRKARTNGCSRAKSPPACPAMWCCATRNSAGKSSTPACGAQRCCKAKSAMVSTVIAACSIRPWTAPAWPTAPWRWRRRAMSCPASASSRRWRCRACSQPNIVPTH